MYSTNVCPNRHTVEGQSIEFKKFVYIYVVIRVWLRIEHLIAEHQSILPVSRGPPFSSASLTKMSCVSISEVERERGASVYQVDW